MDSVLKTSTSRLLLVAGLLVLVMSWVFSLPMRASYPDLITERAYYADPEGREGIDSVQARDFTSFTGPLFRGNDARPLWLRLTLAPSAQPDWVVLYQPNFTQQVETWLPRPEGGWRRVLSGNRYAFSQREIATLAPAVAVRPAADHAITVYARVLTPTTPIHVRVLSREDTAAFDSLMHLVAGTFVGAGLLMTLLSFIVYVSTRDRLWGLDVLFNCAGLGMLALQLGLASRLFWPDSSDLVNQLSLIANCLYVAMSAILYRALFRLFALSRWLLLPYGLVLLMLPLLLWLIARGSGDLAMSLNNAIVMLLSAWGMVIVFRARHADRLILNVFRVAYTGTLLYMLWWGVSVVLRLQTGNLGALYPGMPVSLFTQLMLMLVLARNTQLRLLAAQRMTREKWQAEQRLRFERQRHEDTNSFLGMLLHEVKNPLSTIRMTVANLEGELAGQGESVLRRLRRVHQSVDDVDEVLERGVEVDSLEQGALVLEPAEVNVAALVADFVAGHAAAGRLRAALPEALVASVDSHLCQLMLRNLVDNALKYSPEGSAIDIRLQGGDRIWQLEVRNLAGAAGFPDSERVFSKYYRSPLAMRRNGMGLGLYWVRGVARRMGGTVQYVREQDSVVFRLCLPI